MKLAIFIVFHMGCKYVTDHSFFKHAPFEIMVKFKKAQVSLMLRVCLHWSCDVEMDFLQLALSKSRRKIFLPKGNHDKIVASYFLSDFRAIGSSY